MCEGDAIFIGVRQEVYFAHPPQIQDLAFPVLGCQYAHNAFPSHASNSTYLYSSFTAVSHSLSLSLKVLRSRPSHYPLTSSHILVPSIHLILPRPSLTLHHPFHPQRLYDTPQWPAATPTLPPPPIWTS